MARTASAGIYPAMANAVLMFDALGYFTDHPHLVAARRSIERLLHPEHVDSDPHCIPILRADGARGKW